jgi:hypothetical protein
MQDKKYSSLPAQGGVLPFGRFRQGHKGEGVGHRAVPSKNPPQGHRLDSGIRVDHVVSAGNARSCDIEFSMDFRSVHKSISFGTKVLLFSSGIASRPLKDNARTHQCLSIEVAGSFLIAGRY